MSRGFGPSFPASIVLSCAAGLAPLCAASAAPPILFDQGQAGAPLPVRPPSALEAPGQPPTDQAPSAVVGAGDIAWQVFAGKHAVPGATNRFAAALPEPAHSWLDLERWAEPQVSQYRFEAKGPLGLSGVSAVYAVVRTPGGRWQGRGRYLTGVSVLPVEVKVGPAHSLDMEAEVKDVGNAGTAEEPVASMILVVRWKIRGPGANKGGAAVYYLQGDGQFKELGSGAEPVPAQSPAPAKP